MRLLLVGHTVKDVIKTKEKVIKKPGGLFYSIITALNIINRNDELILLTAFDHELLNKNTSLLSDTNKDYINTTSAVPTVILKIHTTKERDEEYKNLTHKLNIQKLLTFKKPLDGIYLNMITGFDVSSSDLKKLKENFNAPVYIDLHSLTRGIDENKRRFFRLIPDINDWLNSVDFLQVNEHEINSIYNSKNELDIVNFALSHNIKALIKTMGNKGAKIYFKENDEITFAFVSAVKVNSVNQVGCGDAFGVSFFYSYICNRDLIKSLKFANKTAALVSTFNNFDEFIKLKNVVGKRNY